MRNFCLNNEKEKARNCQILQKSLASKVSRIIHRLYIKQNIVCWIILFCPFLHLSFLSLKWYWDIEIQRFIFKAKQRFDYLGCIKIVKWSMQIIVTENFLWSLECPYKTTLFSQDLSNDKCIVIYWIAVRLNDWTVFHWKYFKRKRRRSDPVL